MGDGAGTPGRDRPVGPQAGKPSSQVDHGGTPGKRSLTADLSPQDPTVALEVAVAALLHRTAALAHAIAAVDFVAAWCAAIDLRKTLADAERLATRPGSPASADAIRRLNDARAVADPLLAIAPAPSEDAVRERSSEHPLAAHGPWQREKQRWRAARGGTVDAPHASSPVGAVQPAPVTSAPPDLGNYDSAVGTHVLVLRSWDHTTIAVRRVELQVTLRRMAMGNAVDHEALAALNKAGEAVGVRGVGDEAVASGGTGAAPSHGAIPATGAEPAGRTEGQLGHATGGDHGAHGAAGKTAGFDARPRVTPERVNELSQRLGVPVAIDDTGALRDGIELHYVAGPKGTVQPTILRVGRNAIVDDILAHGDVIGRITRYNGALGKLRKLWDRLVAFLKRAPQPLKPGSPVWESYQELSKLDDLIALRRSARMGHGVVSPEILDREIEFFQGYSAHHEAIIADGEKLGTYGKPSSGHIDSPDRWRDALGGEDPSVAGMREVDPLGNEPHQTRLPVGKAIDPAVPPARANSGFWEDDHARGNTPWHSDNRNVNEITGYKPVEYKDGYPVLDPYTKETVYLKRMLGDERDFVACDKALAKRLGKLKADGTPRQTWAEDYRKANGLTWHHHQDGVRMQLVPFDLHANIPHVGGASATRAAAENL